MSYSLDQKLFYNEKGELFSKVTVGIPMDLNVEFSISHPDKDHTRIIYRVVPRPSFSKTITNYHSIPWSGVKDDSKIEPHHYVEVILYDENNVYCSETGSSNNSKDAQLEPDG